MKITSQSAPGDRTLKWPARTIFGRCAEWIGNSSAMRALARALIPVQQLRSDAIDITYVTWLIPVERVVRFIPEPLKLKTFQNVSSEREYTPISILSFTNGSFGPAFLGSVRKWLCASPSQVNCRVYVQPVDARAPENDAVFYLSVNMQNPLMTLSGRLFADGLPVHYARTLQHTKESLPGRENNAAGYMYTTVVNGGRGSALDLKLQITATSERTLAPDFERVFGSYENAARFVFDRNRAVCVRDKRQVPGDPCQQVVTVVESLIVPPAAGERSNRLIPAETDMTLFEASGWLKDMVDGCEQFSFVISAICINVKGEHVLKIAIK